MTEPRWDDDRLRAAFADRFGRPAPDGLADLTIARARGMAVRRRTVVPAWAGGVAAVLVVTIGGGVLLWARASAPGPSPSPPPATASPEPSSIDRFPAEVLGLPVISVSEAIARRDAGADDSEIAIRGWEPPMPPASCPVPQAQPSPIERWCEFGWLTEQPETLWIVDQGGSHTRSPQGPGLQPLYGIEAPRTYPNPQANSRDPVPVVLVGHFDDYRSGLCPNVDACRREFVVDARVWADGQVAGNEIRDNREPRVDARLERRDVLAAVEAVATPLERPWVALLTPNFAADVDPRIAGTPGLGQAPLMWVVRQLERDGARSVAHTYFVDDATGDVFRSTRANVILALSAGERVVELDEGVRVTITDRTGTIDGVRPIGEEERPAGARLVPGGDHPPIYLWQPESEPRALAVEWVGSPCDTRWSLVVRNTTPTIELDHPAIGACPAIPIRRQVILVFQGPVDVTDVQIAQVSPYAVN